MYYGWIAAGVAMALSLSGAAGAQPPADVDPCSDVVAETLVLLSTDADRLSVDIAGGSLACVLRELGRQGDITIVLPEPAGDDDRIWHKFENLPIYHGVRRLLEQTSYALILGAGEKAGAPPRVVAIRLLRSGPGRLVQDEKFADLVARDRLPAEPQNVPGPISFADRVAGLERLAERNIAHLSDAVSQTLRSDDSDDAALRDLALTLLEGVDGQPPADVLAAMIAAAPTKALRRQALALLAEVSQELSFDAMMQAMEDPDPAISGLARELYADLRMEAVVGAVSQAVQDADWRVRQSALATLEEMQEFAPVGQLAALAANDPNPNIRMQALALLTVGDRQAAIDRLALALSDPNPKISELAEALLAELEQDPFQQEAR